LAAPLRAPGAAQQGAAGRPAGVRHRALLARAFGAYEFEEGGEDEADAALARLAAADALGSSGAAGAFPRRVSVEELEPGQELRGVVQAVRSWGCFVDVGADRDGLVHISRITGEFVDSIHDAVRPGQEVTVWVREVTRDGKLSLAMVERKGKRPVGARPDLVPFQGIPSDKWLPGTVKSVHDYGAFVEVAPAPGEQPASGLVHVNDMSESFTHHPSDVVSIGQEVQVRVAFVDLHSHRLSLSMKDPHAKELKKRTQDVTAFNEVPPTEWLTGTVHHTVTFGAFVEVEPPGGGTPVQGLVHVTNIQDDFVEDPADVLERGDVVRVRVVGADPYMGRLALSMKDA